MSPIKLGVVVGLTADPMEALKKPHDLGFPTCQVTCWREELMTEQMADRLAQAAF